MVAMFETVNHEDIECAMRKCIFDPSINVGSADEKQPGLAADKHVQPKLGEDRMSGGSLIAAHDWIPDGYEPALAVFCPAIFRHDDALVSDG